MININQKAINDRYTIVRELSSGFLGPTLLVEPKITGRMLVCKICHKSFICGSEQIHSFRDRIQQLNNLNLPFVIPFTDIIETDDDFYIFREYVENESLSDYISLSPNIYNSEIKRIFRILLLHFSELHKHNIFRCPIWPTNIFITPDNRILLTDLYELTSDVSWAMTTPNPMHLAFLAPEFFDRTSTPSKYSDIWSLGVILFYMQTKSLPWSTKNICAMIKTITNFDYSLHCNVDDNREFYSLISKCLVHDQQERLQIDEWLHSKRLTKSQSQVSSTSLPKHLIPSAQSLIKPKTKPFLSKYAVLAKPERKIKRKLSAECFSTLTIRYRFVKPGNDNSD